MKTFFMCLILGVAASVSLTARTSQAGELDFRTGNFTGKWCNLDAVYNVTKQDKGEWIFRGTITIIPTGQIDTLWIEQYEDNSIRVIRYLSGDRQGQTQVVEMHPPELRANGQGGVNVVFKSWRQHGYGANGSSSLYMPRR